MYRGKLLFATLYKAKFKDKLGVSPRVLDRNFLLSNVSDNATPLRCVRCFCGHNKDINKNLRWQKTDEYSSYHGYTKESHRSQYSKSTWLTLAGTGLFSYSVWKARHVLEDLRKSYFVYAADDSNKKSAPKISLGLDDKDQEIPEYVPYLLIGAGTASHSAMRSIRLRDHTAQVLIVGEEKNNPYSRPPLSKELWYGEKTGVFYDPGDFYVDPEDLPETKYGGVAVAQGRKVVKLDTEKRIAYLDNFKQIKYDKCLIATGGRPKNLPVFEEADYGVKSKVHLFRTMEDFVRIHMLAHADKSIAVIGGGFLGSELACGMAYRGQNRGLTNLKVYQIFPEEGVMRNVLPDYLSQYTTEKIKEEGVDVIRGKTIKSAEYDDRQVILTLNDGSQIKVDDVVVAVGIQPNDDLAKKSDLEIDPDRGGLMANAELEAKPNVWVAGDVASFYDYKYGRCRMEHYNSADATGKLAGENMTGAKKLYEHQPYFWSDLGSESYQVIGEVDSSLETFSVFRKFKAKDKNGGKSEEIVSKDALDPKADYEGVVFYYREKEIVGILLWNVFGRGKVHAARQILQRSKEIRNEDPYELSKLLFRSYRKQPKENKQKSHDGTS